MLLDDDTLEFQDNGGVVLVSCSLIFQPGHVFQSSEDHQKRQRTKVVNGNGEIENDDSLFSFAIPLVQDKAFHLVQLGELIEAESIQTSHMAIRSAFRQDQDPSLAATSINSTINNSSKDNSQPGLLLQGFQLWSALATHWEDKAFAALWLRDLQSQPQHELNITPPSRFTMVFPAFALKELVVDSVVSIVRSVLSFPASMETKLHESCRNQSGKFWVGLKTFSGNLVVLRFALAESTILIDGEMLRPLEVLLQCSSTDDLSTVRLFLCVSMSEVIPCLRSIVSNAVLCRCERCCWRACHGAQVTRECPCRLTKSSLRSPSRRASSGIRWPRRRHWHS